MKPSIKPLSELESNNNRLMSRRKVIGGVAALFGVTSCGRTPLVTGAFTAEAKLHHARVQIPYKVSMAYWPIDPRVVSRVGGKYPQCSTYSISVDRICKTLKALGYSSLELAHESDFTTIQKNGLICALSYGNSMVQGYNDKRYHNECQKVTRKYIDICAEYGFPNVPVFSGNTDGKSRDSGIRNMVDGLAPVVEYAEKKGVTLVLENLNDKYEPALGHPDVQSNHIDFTAEVVERVGSKRFKLLLDIYHLQIMDGDVINNLRKYKDFIGHIQIAGVPGRKEVDADQELNAQSIFRVIAEIGYTGFVGFEHIPSIDPIESAKKSWELIAGAFKPQVK